MRLWPAVRFLLGRKGVAPRLAVCSGPTNCTETDFDNNSGCELYQAAEKDQNVLRSCSANWSFVSRLDKGIQKNSRGDNSQRTRPAAKLAADRQMAGHQRQQIFVPGDQIVGLDFGQTLGGRIMEGDCLDQRIAVKNNPGTYAPIPPTVHRNFL